jgi:RNA polymerase sigma factor (sigma-70 family)
MSGTPQKNNDDKAVGVDQNGICDQHYKSVFTTLIRRYYPGLIRQEIEDISQEAVRRFLTFRSRRGGTHLIINPLAYLRTTAINIARDRLKAKQLGRETATDPTDIDLTPNELTPVLSEVLNRDLNDRLLEAVQQLPDNQREAIATYFELANALPAASELKFTELAAQVLDISPGQLRGLLYRGLRTLRVQLAHLWEDGPD